MELLSTLFFIAAKQLHSLLGAPPRQTEFNQISRFIYLAPPGKLAPHTRASRAGRALEGRLRHLLHRAVAPPTSTNYRAGIRKHNAFCHKFNLTTLPVTKHSINLFAAYLSQMLQANTNLAYLAAVTHLHLARGFSSPAHSNPTLNLAIKGMQHSQCPAHLRPKRLPLTVEMSGDTRDRSPEKARQRAALTFGFFGFLRVSKYTLATRGGFDPTPHEKRYHLGQEWCSFSHQEVNDRPNWTRCYHIHGLHSLCMPIAQSLRGAASLL